MRSVIVADNHIACEAARKVLNRNHAPAAVLTSSGDMEARSLRRLLASIAGDSETFGQPLKGPSALVLGVETKAGVKGDGRGGRNQELALAALPGIAGSRGFAIAAMGMDGIDGNSPAASAIVESESVARAARMELPFRKFIARHNTF